MLVLTLPRTPDRDPIVIIADTLEGMRWHILDHPAGIDRDLGELWVHDYAANPTAFTLEPGEKVEVPPLNETVIRELAAAVFQPERPGDSALREIPEPVTADHVAELVSFEFDIPRDAAAALIEGVCRGHAASVIPRITLRGQWAYGEVRYVLEQTRNLARSLLRDPDDPVVGVYWLAQEAVEAHARALDALARRDAALKAAHVLGINPTDLAHSARMTRQRVSQIVNR